MRIVYGTKGFKSGLHLVFEVYDFNGNLVVSKEATEIGNLGIYYADIKLSPFRHYIVMIREDNNNWIAYKYIPRFLRWGLRSYDDVKAPEGEKRRFFGFGFNLEDWNE